VLHADGRIEEIGSLGDMALAVMGGMPYSEAQVTLLPGDGFFAFTDGVTEATSPEQALYGEERLEPMLRDRAALSIQQRTDELLASLRAFEGPGNQADDITMLVMQYKANKHG
jgi:serine phosphatase RsbU (regulator of sigma subunit)